VISVEVPVYIPDLPAAVEVAAYRIVQEALTNVVRHAHASACCVRLAIDGEFVIEVTDDGRGIPTGTPHGVGLTSMQERVAELGGTFSLDTAPGGTRIVAQLPLHSEPL
jgi:signal transduction histidine kinase